MDKSGHLVILNKGREIGVKIVILIHTVIFMVLIQKR